MKSLSQSDLEDDSSISFASTNSNQDSDAPVSAVLIKQTPKSQISTESSSAHSSKSTSAKQSSTCSDMPTKKERRIKKNYVKNKEGAMLMIIISPP